MPNDKKLLNGQDQATGEPQTNATRWRVLDQRPLKLIGHLKRT